MDDREDGCLIQVLIALFSAGVVAVLAHDVGHKQGVRDHAAGRYVVVPMPDGTEQVCKVKESK